MTVFAKVSEIAIPAEVARHRFIREAQACVYISNRSDGDPDARVVGTGNSKKCELYGWARNVARHVDRTGTIYFMPILMGFSVVYVGEGKTRHRISLEKGSVYRMDDHYPHWTRDTADVVCAFVGSFEAGANDGIACAELQRGVDALAAGLYYDAPRVGRGYQVITDDQCFAWDMGDDDYRAMLLADARAQDRLIIPCGMCDRPAIKVDDHFPYQMEMSRCAVHLLQKEAA